jgi:membrane-associated phospholipid phosphatase
MKELLIQNRNFFFSAGIYLMLGFVLVALSSMGTIELEVYKLHTPWLTSYFKAVNFLGDGYFLFICFPLIFLFISPRAALITGISVLLTFLLITVLKHYVFPDADRPMRYFKEAILPYLLEGIEENHHNSFPSGHSGQAMAIAATLSVFIRKPSLRVLLLLLAISVAWARVYLMQHFFIDTLAGGIIALLISLLCLNFTNLKSQNSNWDKPLYALFRNKGNAL